MASWSSGRSVPGSGWTGARCPSQHKRPEVYPPNNPTMPVERRWPAGGRVLERRAKDPEMLFRGEDGDAIELNLFVVIL